MRFLGTVRSFFFTKIPAQLKNNNNQEPIKFDGLLQQQKIPIKGHYFYKESMEIYSSMGEHWSVFNWP